MTAHQIIFYVLAAAILITGFLSVTSSKIFRSAIFLLFTLLGVAGLYFWMEVEFIAAVQITVYVGGIVVLIIFSIFLTQHAGNDAPKVPAVRIVSASLAALFGIILGYLIIGQYPFVTSKEVFDPSVTKIGEAMLNYKEAGFSLPFEVISILLLACMVGCIVVAMKPGVLLNNKQTQDEQ